MSLAQSSSATRSKRLSKADRRRQLLDVAKTLLDDGYTGELTLAILADRAGVSKPIAYDHFGTRSGLLVAMLEDISQYYESDAAEKIARAPVTLSAVAEIVATAYIQCAMEAGPAAMVLAAAVEADADARAAGRAVQLDHAASFQRAFEGVLKQHGQDLAPLFRALVAAANAICDDRHQDKISMNTAIETLTHLFVSSLRVFANDKERKRSPS